MNFQVIHDSFFEEITDRVSEYFPSFLSSFEREDGIYPILGELGIFIVENFHNVIIKEQTVKFINLAIEQGGSETEDAIVLQLFQQFYVNTYLASEIRSILSYKSLLVFDRYFRQFNILKLP